MSERATLAGRIRAAQRIIRDMTIGRKPWHDERFRAAEAEIAEGCEEWARQYGDAPPTGAL